MISAYSPHMIAGIVFACIGLIVGTNEWMVKRNWLTQQQSRSTIHLVVGLLVGTFPFLFAAQTYPLILGGIFVVANAAAYRSDRARSMHGDKALSFGTIFFPFAFVLLVLLFWHREPMLVAMSMWVLAIADPVASSVGRRYGHAQTLLSDAKSRIGSTAFSLSALCVLLVSMMLVDSSFVAMSLTDMIISALCAAAFATASEALSWRGSDNVSVPLSTALALFAAMHVSAISVLLMTILAAVIALLGYGKQWLRADGAVGAFVVGGFVFISGGLLWAVPLILFFVLGSLASRLVKNSAQNKPRRLKQVIANGALPAAFALASLFFPDIDWFLWYLGALSAVTSDTLATAIGMRCGRSTYHPLTFQKMQPGTAGGVSIAGCGGAVIGAVVIGAVAFVHYTSFTTASIVVLAGIVGCAVDSIVGASLQGSGDDHIASLVPQRWITNDVVNGIAAIVGTAVVVLAT